MSLVKVKPCVHQGKWGPPGNIGIRVFASGQTADFLAGLLSRGWLVWMSLCFAPKPWDVTSMTNQPAIHRGRLSSEHRDMIIDAHVSGEPVEAIAVRMGRTTDTVAKVIQEQCEQEIDLSRELDRAICFLASLPEVAVMEVVELSNFQRRSSELKRSLIDRLATMDAIPVGGRPNLYRKTEG